MASSRKRKASFQWGLARARRKGLIIVEPAPNELQLDLDGARAIRRYAMQYSILKRAGLTKGWIEHIRPSRRENHIHLTITLPYNLENPTRILWQAILGSDLIREAFNLVRVARGNRYPIVFFEKEAR
jgi:hypothetical protein